MVYRTEGGFTVINEREYKELKDEESVEVLKNGFQTVGNFTIDPNFNKCDCGRVIVWPENELDSWECKCGRIWRKEENK